MRDNPTGRQGSETTCGECGLIRGHRGPCRREQDEGEYAAIDENGESSDASKGCGQGGYKIVKNGNSSTGGHRRVVPLALLRLP
jgi:hypothetical protein